MVCSVVDKLFFLPPEYVSINGSITSALRAYSRIGPLSLTSVDVKIKGDGLLMLCLAKSFDFDEFIILRKKSVA